MLVYTSSVEFDRNFVLEKRKVFSPCFLCFFSFFFFWKELNLFHTEANDWFILDIAIESVMPKPYLTFIVSAFVQSSQCWHKIESACAIFVCQNGPQCKYNVKSKHKCGYQVQP